MPCPPTGDLPNPGIESGSPTLQADSDPLGKPKNTGLCSLSLLQGNFLTQESNWGLLHCRQRILYQLSYLGYMVTLLGRAFSVGSLFIHMFSFQHFEYLMSLPLACKISPEKYADRLIGNSLFYVTICFSLTPFQIISLL